MIIMMVGLQGSGKSTRALEICSERNNKNEFTVILSSDHIRSYHPAWTNEQVFSYLYNDLEEQVRLGSDVIIDATNCTIKSRKKLFTFLAHKNLDVPVIAYVMTTPYITCVERVTARNAADPEHQVPLLALDRYLRSFEIPFLEEGFSQIILDSAENHKEILQDTAALKSLLEVMDDFDQHSCYHDKTLGDHCRSAANYVDKITEDRNLYDAALLHDVGKLWSQQYKKEDINAHYYNHANIGAYYMLSHIEQLSGRAAINISDALDILFYINYHMRPFDWKDNKIATKYKLLFKDSKFANLLALHNADIGVSKNL